MADRYVPRKLVCIACGYAAGLIFAALFPFIRIPLAVVGFASGAVVTALGLVKRRAYITAAGAVLICMGIGSCVYPQGKMPSDGVFEAVVCEADSEGVPFYIVHSDEGLRTGIYLSGESELVRGDRIAVSGTPVEPKNASAMASRGVYSVMYSPDVRIVSHSRGLFSAVSRLRQYVITRIRALETGDSGEMLIGMTFGSRFWRMGTAAQNVLYRSGAGHAAAVSGLHISTAAAFLAGLFRKDIKKRFIAVMAAGAFICLAADLSAPVIRAMVMLAAVYAAPLLGRRSDALTSLCAAALLILIQAPYCITGASFLLSVSGVMGAAVIAPAVTKAVSEKISRDGKHTAADTLISVMCTQTAVLPVSLIFFDEIPVAAPLTNIIVLPLCTAAIFISYAAVMLSFLPALSSVLFVFSVMICRASLTMCTALSGIGEPIPVGYISEAAIAGAAVISLLGFAAGRKTGIAVMVSALSLVMISASVLRAVPYDRTRVFAEQSCAVVAFPDGGAAVDMGKNSYTVRKLAARNGVHPTAVFCTADMADSYRELFPDAVIYDTGIYLDYDVNGVSVNITKDSAVIASNGDEYTLV